MNNSIRVNNFKELHMPSNAQSFSQCNTHIQVHSVYTPPLCDGDACYYNSTEEITENLFPTSSVSQKSVLTITILHSKKQDECPFTKGEKETLPDGVEPSTLRLTAARSNQLSYGRPTSWQLRCILSAEMLFRGTTV